MYKEPHKQYHKGSNSIINTLVNFHQLTSTNKLCMMKGRGITYSNCITNWDEIAI